MLLLASIVALGGMCAAAPAIENAMPVTITSAWTIQVGPGSVTANGVECKFSEAVAFDIAAPELKQVRDECHCSLPIYDAATACWRRGVKLEGVRAEECNATGLLIPESVKVKAAQGDSTPYVLDKDYMLDPVWGNFGRTADGAINARQTTYVDYDFSQNRIDSVVIDKSGKARLIKGESGAALVYPPEPGEGETAVVNVWVPGRTEKLGEDNLYQIDFAPEPAKESAPTQAEQFLPKTLAKLRAGEEVTIVAFGDSVTDGGGVTATTDMWYQNQFATQLRARFPKAKIRMITAGWGGYTSKAYMDSPRGDAHDFVRDVLEPKPDLVTVEFVNDAYLDEAGTAEQYGKILEQVKSVGGELVVITPHLIRPDWMKIDTLKFDEDPRPYVRGLHAFAEKNNVALADASKEWLRLWRKGIPYITLETNNINHPDKRGHAIFAKALMEMFPAS
jgi:lysophospholipase L1-like esterase